MRRFMTACVTAFVFALAGCGGGGGGSDETSPALYKGLVTQAILTSANSMPFFNMVLGNSLTLPETGTGASPVAMAVSSLRMRSAKLSLAVPQATPVSGTIQGTVSGTMTYSGTIEDNGTGTITFGFANFNDGDGITYDGRLIFQILSFDIINLEITHATMSLEPLTIQTPTEHTTVAGTVELFSNLGDVSSTVIFGADGRNEHTGETFRLQNMAYETSCDAPYTPTYCTERVSGRVYLEAEGYVDVNVQSPLQFHHPGEFNVEIPDAGGPVLLTGAAQTSERITPLSISQVRVEVDIDADPEYELSTVYRWADLVGLVLTWENIYGTATNFDVALSAKETSDGSYVAAGWSNTNTANGLDIMLVKTDAAGGLLWTKYLGDTRDDYAQSVRETADGGFVLAGYTDNSVSAYSAVYRLDAGGNTVWSRIFTNDLNSRAYSIEPTADGGFIMTGYIESFSPATGVVGFGMEDLYLVKLDSSGNVSWEKRFGGTATDIGYSVIEVEGGGFAVAGTTGSFDPSQTPDLYLIRADADGNLLWEKHFGDTLTQHGYDLLEDADGNFVVSGVSATLSGYVYSLHKIDATGSTVWSTTFGGTTMYTTPNSVAAAGDGGYVLAGSDSFDVQLFKTDASGNLVWQKTFNWSTFLTMCTASSVERTSDGGYILGGSAWPNTGKDFYLIKTDKDGNL
jgi:hypothetical protein